MLKLKKVKSNPEQRIISWENGRLWLKDNGWRFRMSDCSIVKNEINFYAEKRINGIKIEACTVAKSDLEGIKSLVKSVQEYEAEWK